MRFPRAGATLLLALIGVVCAAGAKKKPDSDARLKNIHSIFIAGNNPTAINARADVTDERFVRRLKICFSVAEKPDQADATLEISEVPAPSKVYADSMNASGSLTLRTGELIWSFTPPFPEDVANLRATFLVSALRRAVCGN